ncbi:hybrid sensor histidine kinase/response regulator transcription factor [Chitinophaga barathri]|uniref:histidine kinase n=1 Tax=Chitinophaga barathri TaxID=1647451 RepID=A0A3N4MDS6_9BACT|nr:hybrid sensor histidine kinase/response regulator transcription factor [Chitinophaga barathri]RPD42034.1 hybrid sensor histidine kinase/response regulator [Chitinophaga barathri]
MLQKYYLLLLSCMLLSRSHAQQLSQEFSTLNIHHGLSNNQVNCIYKDAKGFLWFGTMGGLNRYDGSSFRNFRHSIADSLSLSDDYIMGIFAAPGNRMYVKTRNGDNLYDPVLEQFTPAAGWLKSLGLPQTGVNSVLQSGDTCWIAYADSGLYRITGGKKGVRIPLNNPRRARIADIKKENNRHIMLLYMDGGLVRLDAGTGRSLMQTDTLLGYVPKPPISLQLFIDAQQELWIYMPGSDFGALYYNPRDRAVRRLSKRNMALNNDIVNSIIQDAHGRMWIGTDHGGVNVVDKKDFSTTYITNRIEDTKSIAENAIYALYKDDQGIIWCGTYKRGVSYYAENKMKFRLYEHKHGVPNSLPYNDVNCFAEDSKGNVWIGTNGGGLIYFDRKTNSFKQYKHDPADDNSISNDVIVSLYTDRYDNLWIGYYFGGMDYYNHHRFSHYRHNPQDPNSLANKTVWKIYRDRRNTFWIGTLGGGLDRFDPGNGIFYHNNAEQSNSVHSNYITAFAETPSGDLWISTAYGIDVLDKSKGIFIHLRHGTHGLSNDNVSSLLCDSRGLMWAGTREGLNLFDPATRTFRTFRAEQGLPDDNIISILEDRQGFIWVSTTRGLSKIAVEQGEGGVRIKCRNYDDDDGLQGKVFNVNASLSLRSGELVFGGADGFNIFKPEEIHQYRTAPSLVFTSLQLFNKPVGVNEKFRNHVVLPAALPETQALRLRYNENDFSIDFASLNFIHSDKNRYTYFLEGFNKEWMVTDGRSRRITYTNINPGEYTLHLKSADEDGQWNSQGISLQIRILPPFWKTPWAYALYILAAIALLYFSRKMVITRAHRRFALQQERKEAQRLHDLDMMKIKLLTNVSHEFRTPVALILSPIEDMIRKSGNPEEKQQFQLIRRNAKRLLNLVNQLMDFRKMEMQELKPVPVKGELMGFLEEVAQSFSDLAERKGVEFSYTANCPQLNVFFDHDKVERILFNLLSNAFKFTPQGGKVSVTAEVTPEPDQAILELKVKDTGIGMPAEQLEKIFERFFQSDQPGQYVNQGSGIGLAITREFVKLHNGTIAVESEADKGTSFTVRLPFTPAGQAEAEVPALPQKQVFLSNGKKKNKKRQTILIVEDNEDFRFYLKDNLREYYDIIEAPDGAAGWQQALAQLPDLVVSDITMPVMDGVELCRKMAGDARTRNIPVILLTAQTAEEEQLKGLETGAADYLIKPFNFEIMLSRVRNLLARQAPVQLVIPQKEPEGANGLSGDEKFMQRALEIVEKHLSDPAFSVEALSRELCMNRVSVYKRIFALTGHPPIEFIRTVRLQKAAMLLTKTEMNITEVAYEVGFNNPKYFARYFKMAYHMLPSAYATAMRK